MPQRSLLLQIMEKRSAARDSRRMNPRALHYKENHMGRAANDWSCEEHAPIARPIELRTDEDYKS